MIPIGDNCPYCNHKIYALSLAYCPNCGALLKGTFKELDQTRIQNLYRQADAAREMDEWSEAIYLLIDALKLNPENETTQQKLADFRHQFRLHRQYEWAQEHYFARHLDDALKNLREIEREEPENEEVQAFIEKIETEKLWKNKKAVRKARRRVFFNGVFNISYYLLMIGFLITLIIAVFLLIESSIY